AAAAAGHTHSSAESEAFYRRIVEELEAAAAGGRVATRTVPPLGFHPCPGNYFPPLPARVAKPLAPCWAAEEPPPLTGRPPARNAGQCRRRQRHRQPFGPGCGRCTLQS